MRLAGVDIGGTAVKYGIFNERGNEIAYKECATQSKQIIDDIIRELHALAPFDAIGISAAGLIDPINGVIVEGSVNIPGMDGLKIKELLENEFNVPNAIENDVNAAALAESAFGSGKDISNFCFLHMVLVLAEQLLMILSFFMEEMVLQVNLDIRLHMETAGFAIVA